jgi:glycerol-3-phosphate dehydrogenase (NAD(P)+)
MIEPEPTATPDAPEGKVAPASPGTAASPTVAASPGGRGPGSRGPRARSLPTPGAKRATVIGAGSFGTALAVLLARGGLRTTLQARTAEQAASLERDRENRVYLPGVELPAQLRIEPAGAGVARADYVFLAVPSSGLDEVIAALEGAGLDQRAAVVSVAKGLVPPDGLPPTTVLGARFGHQRIACLGGPAHAQEMVNEGAGLVAASSDEELTRALAQVFTRAGVVCEQSNDPLGVELAGAAKNAAALAAGATEAQGLNAAGAAAGHIFAEVWRYAAGLGARPESMIGLAGAGDLVATALARDSRNRRAGELLAAGVPAAEIPARIGQAVESLESVPLLARALERADVEIGTGGDGGTGTNGDGGTGTGGDGGTGTGGDGGTAAGGDAAANDRPDQRAPITSALGRLISGELPLDDWVALVRATVPPPARWRRARPRPGFWRRAWRRIFGRAR